MVTAKAQLNLRSAQNYFQEHLAVGDYYEQGQKVSGEWIGEGAKRLELSGVVRSEEFLALCGNRHPQSGERLTQRLNDTRRSKGQETANRRIFYDFTFSPPKSVSILALVAEDGRLVDAHHRALQIALQEFEQFAAVRLRQKGARDYRVTKNIVAAQFTHNTSRALDPHLHTHCIVFNASFDAAEGRWKALENYDMLRARKYVENVYYHELAKDIRRFGYSICNHRRGDFEVQGVPAELCQRFSKRHKQIDEALAELLRAKPELDGSNLKAIRERLATAERARKMRDVGKAELRSLWQGQLTRAENEPLPGLAKQQVVAEPAPSSQALEEAISWAEEHLFDRRSVVLEHEIWLAALERMRGKPVTLESLKALTSSRGYIRDTKHATEVTLPAVLRREREIVLAAQEGVSAWHPLVRAQVPVNPDLDDEQLVALQTLLKSRDGITLFRGGAGTGKSFVLRELVRCLETQHRPVVVLAPQRQQVEGLMETGFPSPTTVADFLVREAMPKNAVVVVDEAGQIGGKQMLQLIRLVEARQGRLVLSGDTRQHGPVEASDALVAIEKYSGIQPAELHTIRRQNPQLAKDKEERKFIAEYRRAVAEAADGKIRQSFDRLDRMGTVVVCRLDRQQEQLAEDYLRLAEQGASTVVVSQTWSEVHRVNERVRAGLKAKGLLGPMDTPVQALDKIDLTNAQKRDVRFYPDDAVTVFQMPFRKVAVGTTARFLAATEAGVILEASGHAVVVPNRFLDRIGVFRPIELSLTSGDRLQIKANRKLLDGSKVTNGELVTVRAVHPDGAIELNDGRVVDSGYREFVPGYAVTSYGSQGKDVDCVLFSDSTIKAATNDQQWYVTISRGRKGIRIFTPDKAQLRENVIRSGQRKLALELRGGERCFTPVPRFGWFRRMEARLLRFGRRASQHLVRARRFARFNTQTIAERHEQQINRLLSP